MINALATVNKDIEQCRSKFLEIERWLDEAPISEVSAALSWIKDAQALIKLRKNMEHMFITSKRLEAKILRKLGQAGVVDGLSYTHQTNANKLARMSEAEFTTFCASLNDGYVLASNIQTYFFKPPKRAFELDADEFNPNDCSRADIAYHAQELLKELYLGDETKSVSDIVVDLAERLDLEQEEAAVKEGLSQIVRTAITNTHQVASEVYDQDNDTTSIIPQAVTFEDFHEWVRVPWNKALMSHLLFMVELREHQATQIKDRAESLRTTYELLKTIQSKYGITDNDNCCEILEVGTSHGDFYSIKEPVSA